MIGRHVAIDCLVIVASILSLVPALLGLVNLALMRTPKARTGRPGVSILIPARDEESAIGACIDAALASRDVDLDVIVLDDGSQDATRAIVLARAAADPRLRLIDAPPLAPGCKGKAAACQALADASRKAFLLFIDADVRLSPDAAARLVPPPGIDLQSGIPWQDVAGLVPMAVVPMIATILYGYLPLPAARAFPHSPRFAAACGQLMMVRASAYRACGGHAGVGSRMHEALHLARGLRSAGFVTDLVDGSRLARCHMYTNAKDVFAGFGKNATEGMARPLALPIWTILLVGGHILPFVTLPLALRAGSFEVAVLACAATALLLLERIVQKLKCREPWFAVFLHPVGIVLTLAIQYKALFGWLRGKPVTWKGRSYSPTL